MRSFNMLKQKVLVANRSEIACRVFQACREMELPTVGIVAPGDEQGRHATYADEIQNVVSYLDIPAVIHAAKSAGATLVHPGYGFLSERPEFAAAVEAAGMTFIGPRAETMRLMGEKIGAKILAEKNGVPTLPWARVELGGDIQAAARKVGFPLLLKASAGGGGKGMRRVDQAKDLMEAAESASSEAFAAFGDGTLFLERFLDRPRHIEVQVFGDGMGNGVHLYERECSLQRRHQKIWEESPASHLDSAFSKSLREELFFAALRLVKATQYRNAGTVEFLVDSAGSFYFLEMNTRLQVEHPVTELVTGVDLVWAQILQAQNPNQSVLTEIPAAKGHAIEVRLYAEDPAQGFIPTPGRVGRLRWPTGAGIRVESGIEEGQTVGTQFDSLLGKVVVSAENRGRALKRLRFALEETVILGVGTNQNYLRSLLDHKKIQEGIVDTHFLSHEFSPFQPTLPAEDLEIWSSARELGISRPSSLEGLRHSQESDSSLVSPWSAFRKEGAQ